jgi:hypothetical protein
MVDCVRRRGRGHGFGRLGWLGLVFGDGGYGHGWHIKLYRRRCSGRLTGSWLGWCWSGMMCLRWLRGNWGVPLVLESEGEGGGGSDDLTWNVSRVCEVRNPRYRKPLVSGYLSFPCRHSCVLFLCSFSKAKTLSKFKLEYSIGYELDDTTFLLSYTSLVTSYALIASLQKYFTCLFLS